MLSTQQLTAASPATGVSRALMLSRSTATRSCINPTSSFSLRLRCCARTRAKLGSIHRRRQLRQLHRFLCQPIRRPNLMARRSSARHPTLLSLWRTRTRSRHKAILCRRSTRNYQTHRTPSANLRPTFAGRTRTSGHSKRKPTVQAKTTPIRVTAIQVSSRRLPS